MAEKSIHSEEINTTEVTRSAEDTTASPGIERTSIETEISNETRRVPPNRNATLITIVAVVALVAVFGLLYWSRKENGKAKEVKASAEESHGEEKESGASGKEVALSPEAMKTAGIEIAGVTQRPAVVLLRVTGSVEANQQQTQSATPLVGGRVERVNVALGDHVGAGATLATIASPEIAEMRGRLREAQTRLQLAERNLARVQRSENRVAVLSAKAKLDEAEATLKRTRRLIELGVGAGKDLVAADANYKTAKAEYEFQSNIALNREVQQAQAEVETARVEVSHLQQSLRALGASENGSEGNAALIAVRAPASGVVTERLVNAGAGVEAGKPLFTIGNLSTVWVIANVPEAQLGSLHPGTPAEIRSAALGTNAIAGRVNYIDPQLSEETRTARVRMEVANVGERLKTGMFVEVGLQTSTGGKGAGGDEELMIPSEAVQRIADRTVVFVPEEDEPGHFKVRDVELGAETEGYRRVLSGLEMGERVVTKGSFTLKAQLLKGQFGEDVD